MVSITVLTLLVGFNLFCRAMAKWLMPLLGFSSRVRPHRRWSKGGTAAGSHGGKAGWRAEPAPSRAGNDARDEGDAEMRTCNRYRFETGQPPAGCGGAERMDGG